MWFCVAEPRSSIDFQPRPGIQMRFSKMTYLTLSAFAFLMRYSEMRSPVEPAIMMSTASPVLWSEPVPGRRPPKVLTSGNFAHTAR